MFHGHHILITECEEPPSRDHRSDDHVSNHAKIKDRLSSRQLEPTPHTRGFGSAIRDEPQGEHTQSPWLEGSTYSIL